MQRNHKLIVLFAGAAAIVAAGAALADRGPGPDKRGERGLLMLQAADLDGDNTVTRDEVQALRAEMFAWLDRTGDGVLTIDDRSPIEQRLAANAEAAGIDFADRKQGRMMKRVDADADGRITREEFLAAPEPVFERLDADADGAVTPAELDAAAEARDAFRRWWR